MSKLNKCKCGAGTEDLELAHNSFGVYGYVSIVCNKCHNAASSPTYERIAPYKENVLSEMEADLVARWNKENPEVNHDGVSIKDKCGGGWDWFEFKNENYALLDANGVNRASVCRLADGEYMVFKHREPGRIFENLNDARDWAEAGIK